MIAITRIPTHGNDGSKVSKREWRAILTRVCKVFGGYSLDPPAEGGWIASDGRVFEEPSRKLEVVISEDQVHEARNLFIAIGKQLGQLAIYFEIRESGEIIDLG